MKISDIYFEHRILLNNIEMTDEKTDFICDCVNAIGDMKAVDPDLVKSFFPESEHKAAHRFVKSINTVILGLIDQRVDDIKAALPQSKYQIELEKFLLKINITADRKADILDSIKTIRERYQNKIKLDISDYPVFTDAEKIYLSEFFEAIHGHTY